MKSALLTLLSVCILIAPFAGCGIGLARITDFPNAIIGVDGEVIVMEDIFPIVDSQDLTSDEKRDKIRELGIEDPDLIEALLDLQNR